MYDILLAKEKAVLIFFESPDRRQSTLTNSDDDLEMAEESELQRLIEGLDIESAVILCE